MKCVIFLSVCLLVVHQSAAYDPNQPHSRQHRQVPHSDLSRYLYRQPSHNERPVRDTQEYKYDFERYNDIHPPNERQTKFQKYDQEKVLNRDASHKCLEYCRKCGSSFGKSYVCAEDVSYHQPPLSFMLFSNKCQMKCYNKCHNTNYRYSTNSLCQKVMSVLEKDDSTPEHPKRHERHHVWVNSQKMYNAKH